MYQMSTKLKSGLFRKLFQVDGIDLCAVINGIKGNSFIKLMTQKKGFNLIIDAMRSCPISVSIVYDAVHIPV